MRVRDDMILSYIAAYWQEFETSPTLMQIAQGLELKPPENFKSAVFYACERLRHAGKLETVTVTRSRTYRGWRVPDDGQEG